MSRLETVNAHLEARGFEGRGKTLLALGLSANLYHGLNNLRDRDTTTERNFAVSSINNLLTNTIDPLWDNKDAWQAEQLNFASLTHAFNRRQEHLVEDAGVARLLSSFRLGAWGKTKAFYGELIPQDLDSHLAELAKKIAGNDWKTLSLTAAEFAESNLSTEIEKAAQEWTSRAFSPSSKSGSAVDIILETGQILARPSEVIEVARLLS
ncbi:MAG: hypothetical protein KA035_01950 [Candidatus Levybacteria bacterium]|nr:hypothetical protein [Candidatus Levybacteria bacterium]